MFCDGCGTVVQPGQSFCSKCGKQIVGPISVMQPRPGRVQGHVRLLALFWLAFSAFNTVGAVILYVLANTLFAHMNEMGNAPAFLRPLLSVVAILLFAKAAIGFIAGCPCACPGFRFAVHQHSVWNCAWRLHHVGAALGGLGARVRCFVGSARRGLRADKKI
jgi:hypothetical protein